ncbi:STAS domain-containing protein [Chitinibacter bivalviorum]|uniref:STAS domain-containing protein n=1 Tax=Chitinibacter bivalviorum TaxID=2739434 RepID=A0A7H9BF92_9NEIS|nr:STAS domain-containing protein [Chitinibacter bivalviorum]QLG86858.1 STAS domain-containing protein [Chitinibacter bivalviorum]
MFSFFRKKGPDGQEVLTQTGPVTQTGPATQARVQSNTGNTVPAPNAPATASAPAPSSESAYDLSKLSIEVSSSSDSLSPAEEQAAMLYANGQSNAAINILLNDKPHFVGKRRLESWLMLFELLQQHNQKEAFDALGLDFVVEFEKTPPTWQAVHSNTQVKASASGYHAFSGNLTHDTIDKQVNALRLLQEKNDQLRIDFSKLTGVDTLAAAELLAALQHNHKNPNSLQLIGSDVLTQLLKEKIEVGRRHPAEAPFWLLLIELQQLLGLQDDFENLAVDYAITFEVSPPSWDARQTSKSVAQIAAAEALAKAEIQAAEKEKSLLTGTITAQTPANLEKLIEQVESSLSPVIDLRQITRIDFDSAGQMLNLAMKWLQEGRQVRFINTNPLVHTLLRVMSIHEMLSVELRK